MNSRVVGISEQSSRSKRTYGARFGRQNRGSCSHLIDRVTAHHRELEMCCLEKQAYLSVLNTSATLIHQIELLNKGSGTPPITAAEP